MLFRSFVILGGAVLAAAKVQFMGINIAGFEFGCLIDGTCPTGSASPPLSDGPGQMQHFVNDDKLNIFRLPVSWQFLVSNKLGGTLDSTNFGKYDQLMQACLATGAYCAIDVHNFARWNGKIIGQDGGPTDAQFADLWTQLATKYKSSTKVIFGLMNEPHDIDITAWAASCQAAVTAIRNAGATSQMILLPGNNFTSAATFVSGGSGAALLTVKNPDGTTTGLLMDIHKYLDSDNSGNHAECTTDNIEAFTSVAQFLRENSRQAIVSETGAGSTDSCFTAFCAQNTFINQNSDVYLGLIAWAAGSFATSYTLSLTPSKANGKFTDNKLASQCVVSNWLNAPTAIVTSAVVASSAAPTVASSVNLVVSSSTTTAPKASGSSSGNSASKVVATKSEGTTLVASSIPSKAATVSAEAPIASSTSSISSGSKGNSSSSTSSGSSAVPSTQISGGFVSRVFSGSLMVGVCGVFAVLWL